MRLFLLILLAVKLFAGDIPVSFYKDATVVDKKFYNFKKLRLQIADENDNVKSKFVQGFYWKYQYKFNTHIPKKTFMKQMRDFISKNGEVLFHGSNYIHFKIFKNNKVYWGSITYNKGKFLLKLVETSDKRKILKLNSDEKYITGAILSNIVIPKIMGYKVDKELTIYKNYSQEKINNKTLEGRYWFVVYKRVDDSLEIMPSELLDSFKNELLKIKGKVVDVGKDKIVFNLDNIYGEFRASKDLVSIEIVQKVDFKESLNLNFENEANIRLYGITFDTGKDTIKEGSEKTLKMIVKLLTDMPDLVIEIQGHTDDVGDEKKNLILSEKRAQSVKKALVDMGIDEKRLVAKGYGESKPLVPNDTKANRAKNRRVELKKLSGGLRKISIELFKPLGNFTKSVKKFENGKIVVGKDLIVNGREVKAYYKTDEKNQDNFSTIEIVKNYELLVKKLKGKVIKSSKDRMIFRFEKDDIWGRLSAFKGYYYISLIYKKVQGDKKDGK